jgi:hypothetical protein
MQVSPLRVRISANAPVEITTLLPARKSTDKEAALAGYAGGGLADDEGGLYGDAAGVGGGGVGDAVEKDGGGQLAHVLERLADGGEAGDVVLGGDDVVEANDGDVGGDAHAGFVEDAHGADGGGVVEGDEGGEEVSWMVRSGVGWTPHSRATCIRASQRNSVSMMDGGPFMKAILRWPRS